MLYNDDNSNNSNSIHDKSVRNLAVDNPRGDFCCPQFPGRNEIWDIVFLRGRDNWRMRGKIYGARTRSNPRVTPVVHLLRVPVI